MKCKKGFKSVKGKCKKINKFLKKRNNKKKSYDILKMWGSWIGGLLSIIIILKYNLFLEECYLEGSFVDALWSCTPIMIPMIFGIILGWIIHSLFRRFLK